MLDEQLYLQLNPATFAAMEYGGTQLILAEKIVDITRYMADTVISGVASNSLTICLYSLGIFLIFLILNFLWSMIMRVRRGGPNATMKGTMSQTYYDWREALKNQR
jgi:TM2 domain-containing membrane protein YozV